MADPLLSLHRLLLLSLCLGGCVRSLPSPSTTDGGCGCAIDEICYLKGDPHPSDPCRRCDPELDPAAWTPAPGCVGTLVGGTAGFRDGPASSALLGFPEDLAIDGEGRLYIADASNRRVRVVHRGQVRTLAGDGASRTLDGPALSASFQSPHGLAVDAKGRVFVADLSGRRLRLIEGGVVSTVAGTGTAGSDDGPALQATLTSPAYLAVASSGRLYFTDWGVDRIRYLESGAVKTLVGPSLPGRGPLHELTGLAVDASGVLFVAESAGQRVLRVQGSDVATLSGLTRGFADGPPAEALFSEPEGLALAGGGRLVVADWGNSAVRLVEPDGAVRTVAGSPARKGFADGPVATAEFAELSAVVVDAAGRIYVSDSANSRIRVIVP